MVQHALQHPADHIPRQMENFTITERACWIMGFEHAMQMVEDYIKCRTTSSFTSTTAPQATVKSDIPADCDVRKILLRVVPGDGSGHEVYAKSIADVEALLSDMDGRLETFESARAVAPQFGATLTDEQIRNIFWKVQDQKGDYLQFARALLAAHSPAQE